MLELEQWTNRNREFSQWTNRKQANDHKKFSRKLQQISLLRYVFTLTMWKRTMRKAMWRILFSPRNVQYIFIKIFEFYQKATESQDRLRTGCSKFFCFIRLIYICFGKFPKHVELQKCLALPYFSRFIVFLRLTCTAYEHHMKIIL